MEERQASHKWKGGSATISMVPIADRERGKSRIGARHSATKHAYERSTEL